MYVTHCSPSSAYAICIPFLNPQSAYPWALIRNQCCRLLRRRPSRQARGRTLRRSLTASSRSWCASIRPSRQQVTWRRSCKNGGIRMLMLTIDIFQEAEGARCDCSRVRENSSSKCLRCLFHQACEVFSCRLPRVRNAHTSSNLGMPLPWDESHQRQCQSRLLMHLLMCSLLIGFSRSSMQDEITPWTHAG